MDIVKSKQKLLLCILCAIASMVLPSKVYSSDYEASLLITGPGKPLYTHWGHIGIVLQNNLTGQSRFYDFGNFSLYTEHFYDTFIKGHMWYSHGESNAEWFIERSKEENAELTLYPLNLGSDEIKILRNRLNWWSRLENRNYLYHYYINNCSTIIRDILDEVTGGQIKAQTETIPDRTFRYYTRAYLSESRLSELMLHFLLGPFTDRTINGWELMFLPYEVAHFIQDFEYTATNGTRKFFADEKIVLKELSGPPIWSEPKPLWPLLLLAGLLVAVLWCVFDGRESGRWLQLLVVLLVGVPGAVLGYFIAFTDHLVTYGNLNLYPTFPTVILVIIPLFARKIPKRQEITSWIWSVNLIGLLAAMVLNFSGLINQHISDFLVFYAPLTLVASYPGLLIRRYAIDALSSRYRGLYFPRFRMGRIFRFPFAFLLGKPLRFRLFGFPRFGKRLRTRGFYNRRIRYRKLYRYRGIRNVRSR